MPPTKALGSCFTQYYASGPSARYLLQSLTQQQHILLLFFLVIFLSHCKTKNKNANTQYFNTSLQYCKTVKQLNNVVLSNNFSPVVASRNYAYATIAAYEVIAAADTNYKSLALQIKHLPVIKKPDTTNVDIYLATLFAFCKVGEAVTFPEGSMQTYVAAIKQQADSVGFSSQKIKATKIFADSIANQILAWSKKDHYLQLRTATKYAVTDADDRWRPTPPMYAQAVEPHWMEMRNIIMDSSSECMPPRPPVFNIKNKSSAYYKAALEVKNVGLQLTQEQKDIALFWDDNPFKLNVIGHVNYATKKFSPPGHWLNIIGIVAQQANYNFKQTVAVYAHTAIALYDAFICSWDEKYRSNTTRPQTIIQKFIDPNWEPFIQTPPFPSYTSGHATVSAAVAEVLTFYMGNALAFKDTSLVEFGIAPRSFANFKTAANEASSSRLYGGIHFIHDNEAGKLSGEKLGKLVVKRISTFK